MFVAPDSFTQAHAHRFHRTESTQHARLERYFTGRTFGSVDWSRQALVITSLGFVLGGVTSALSAPFVTVLATLAVAVWYLTSEEFGTGLNAWLQRANMWVAAGFYGLLGSLFGVFVLAAIPAFLLWVRTRTKRA